MFNKITTLIVLVAGQVILAPVLQVLMTIQDAGQCAVWDNNTVLIILLQKIMIHFNNCIKMTLNLILK